jgi:hypothetical protein
MARHLPELRQIASAAGLIIGILAAPAIKACELQASLQCPSNAPYGSSVNCSLSVTNVGTSDCGPEPRSPGYVTYGSARFTILTGNQNQSLECNSQVFRDALRTSSYCLATVWGVSPKYETLTIPPRGMESVVVRFPLNQSGRLCYRVRGTAELNWARCVDGGGHASCVPTRSFSQALVANIAATGPVKLAVRLPSTAASGEQYSLFIGDPVANELQTLIPGNQLEVQESLTPDFSQPLTTGDWYFKRVVSSPTRYYYRARIRYLECSGELVNDWSDPVSILVGGSQPRNAIPVTETPPAIIQGRVRE